MRIQGGCGEGGRPLLVFFFENPLFPLCAYAINEDEADKLSSAPFNIFGSATECMNYVGLIKTCGLHKIESILCQV